MTEHATFENVQPRGLSAHVGETASRVDGQVVEAHGVTTETVVFDNVSKFYGEVLGVNRVSLTLAPGIVGLVGPNGAGKTTLMNLMTGLLRPTRGEIRVLGIPTTDPVALCRQIGYCSQWDAFPRGMSGYKFVRGYLRVHGYAEPEAEALAHQAIARVGLTDAAHRRIGGYSKGMRQRIKLAQAIAHDPRVLVLDEPLNGLDPMARAEVIEIFQSLASTGRHVIISSHILHEVDMIADQVVLLTAGYVIAEGEVGGVRSEMAERPIQVLVRTSDAPKLASKLFEHDHVTEVSLHDDRLGLEARTRDAESFYLALNRFVVELGLEIETVTVADADVRAVYQYLIGSEGEGP
ncbi:MAG: ABC transporter ATP-binding protein [Acidobacteriota bacterium]